jgi:CxC4 like cysteine cluster associated with KDZ transposases
MVSHLPILPPPWALLPIDPLLYTRTSPYRKPLLQPFSLQPSSSCPCPSGRTHWDPSRPHILRWCHVYTLDGVHRHEIELQPCRTCPPARRRFIGPDLREEGLFNFNNNIVVSHELLDEYTSAYTTSETPFSAWVAHLSRRYLSSGHAFMGEDLFRSVWFGYAGLQAFNDDFTCQRCGSHPESLICDGITLAFGRKHLRDSLHPPTETSDTSVIRTNVKYKPKQQLLESVLRKQLRVAMKAPSLDIGKPDRDNESESESEDSECSGRERRPSRITDEQKRQHSNLVRDHLDRITVVRDALHGHCPELADLFVLHFGVTAYSARKPAPASIRNFFSQVSVFTILHNLHLPNGFPDRR